MNCSKILLVDDDEDDQLIFSDIIIRDIKGAPECMIANNGLEALSLLKTLQTPPCIIFLDLNMPYISGFECLEKIRQNDALKKVPVVIFTTSESPFDRKRAKEFGANHYLTKNSDLKILRSMVQEVFTENFKDT